MPSDAPDEVQKLADALDLRRVFEGGRYVTKPPTREELRTLARRAFNLGARTALDLHSKTTRYLDPAYEFSSYESYEAYVEMVGDDDPDLLPIERMETFDLCAECARSEAEAHDGDDDWSYIASVWPCRTAEALAAYTTDEETT